MKKLEDKHDQPFSVGVLGVVLTVQDGCVRVSCDVDGFFLGDMTKKDAKRLIRIISKEALR